MYIRHLSTLINNELPEALDLVCNFIWSDIPCDNVRVELYHFKDETGKVNVENFMKQPTQAKDLNGRL